MVPGVVDSDYTGEIKALISLPDKTVQISKGQRIAQLLLLPYYQTRRTLSSHPCVESSLVLLEEGVCHNQCILLAKLN